MYNRSGIHLKDLVWKKQACTPVSWNVCTITPFLTSLWRLQLLIHYVQAENYSFYKITAKEPMSSTKSCCRLIDIGFLAQHARLQTAVRMTERTVSGTWLMKMTASFQTNHNPYNFILLCNAFLSFTSSVKHFVTCFWKVLNEYIYSSYYYY